MLREYSLYTASQIVFRGALHWISSGSAPIFSNTEISLYKIKE